MTTPLVSIVIINWNGITDTLTCLNSLNETDYSNISIIVVDNNSSDNSLKLLKEFKSKNPLKIIANAYNAGFAEGNNIGIREALKNNTDYILLLNNDTTIDKNCIKELVVAEQKLPNPTILGPIIFYMNSPNKIWFAGAKWNEKWLGFEYSNQDNFLTKNIEKQTDYVCGAALFFRKDIIDSIGLFDERFFLVYEESDWCQRAIKAGFSCEMVPDAFVWHKVGASFGSESSPLRQYFSFRNRLLWSEKNKGFREWFNILIRSISILMPNIKNHESKNNYMIRNIYWSLIAYKNYWKEPNFRAKKRALFDYLIRRFGDCPQEIRMLRR